MPLCDYFSAPDDATAVAVLETPGGPSETSHDVVCLKNIDPVVCLAHLEAILAGCDFDEALERPRAGELLSSPDADSAWVVSVSDTLQSRLAAASDDGLVSAAAQWSATDEPVLADMDLQEATDVLEALAGLSRRAQASGERLYCWLAL